MTDNSKNTLSDTQEMEKRSFRRGWMQLRQKDVAEAKRKLMEAAGQNSNPGFHNRLNGLVEPKVSEAVAIEAVFAEYGITDVWGE